MASLPINLFDAAIYLCLIVAVITGFTSGLLRSLATIFGYLCTMPLAVTGAPWLSRLLIEQFKMPQAQTWVAFVGIFLIAGMALSALFRLAVSEMVGPEVNIADRIAGAFLGAVRVGLLAVLIVVIFDRIIPANREPAFLANSRLRPILSVAGQQGLRSLPPDVLDFIDRLKKQRGI
jgi:membrane protein required for colicin V production